MSLKDDLEKAISEGEAAREREPLAQEEFYEEWLVARVPILATFNEAAEILAARFGPGSSADRDNGAIFLEVTRDGALYKLTLQPDKRRKEIACLFSPPELHEPQFRPAGSFTGGAVARILTDFVYAVAATPKPEKPGFANVLLG